MFPRGPNPKQPKQNMLCMLRIWNAMLQQPLCQPNEARMQGHQAIHGVLKEVGSPNCNEKNHQEYASAGLQSLINKTIP